MDSRCVFLKIIKSENGVESWLCHHQYAKRGLIQSCFLKTGPCRYSNGPFPPEPEKGCDEGSATGKGPCEPIGPSSK